MRTNPHKHPEGEEHGDPDREDDGGNEERKRGGYKGHDTLSPARGASRAVAIKDDDESGKGHRKKEGEEAQRDSLRMQNPH